MKNICLMLSLVLFVLSDATDGYAQGKGRGLTNIDNESDAASETKKPTPLKKTDESTSDQETKTTVTQAGSKFDKRVQAIRKTLEGLDQQEKIKVKIKTLDDATETLERYKKRFTSPGGAKPTKQTEELTDEQKRQRKRLQIAIKRVERRIAEIRKSKFSSNGAKERLAIRELKLNRLLFEVYREGTRAELLAARWARERSLPALDVRLSRPNWFPIRIGTVITLSLTYQEPAPEPRKINAGSNGARGNVVKKVEVPIHNANIAPKMLQASCNPDLVAIATVDKQRLIHIKYALSVHQLAMIDDMIAAQTKTRLRAEAAMLSAGNLGPADYQRTLDIDEIETLRQQGTLEIDVCTLSPLRDFAGQHASGSRLWRLQGKPVLILHAKVADSKQSNKNAKIGSGNGER